MFLSYATHPRRFAYLSQHFRGSSTTPRSGHLRPRGRVIYDPAVGSSTTPRSGHLRPHGRVIYDPTVRSSTTPRSGRLSLYFSKFTQLLLFLRTIELICVVTYNCPQCYVNNYVQLSAVLREQLRTTVRSAT